MAFLDNSGDIILDAVLTDHGRKLLAQGDGTFEITQFALADDEIDYSLYNKTHPSGSAYYDLEILQTPVLESFANNGSSMKSKLVSFEDLEILFLPTMKINQNAPNTAMHASGSFFVAVDSFTEDDDGSQTSKKGVVPDATTGADIQGFMRGETMTGETYIRVDQGLDTTEISARQSLDSDLYETDYTVQIDNRLGRLVSIAGSNVIEDYIDDDKVAYYTVSLSDTQSAIVQDIGDTTDSTHNVIKGPRGSKLRFKIKSSNDLNTSTYLFERLGSTQSLPNRGGTSTTVYYIDSMVRVTGVKTGQQIDIPIRYVKYKS